MTVIGLYLLSLMDADTSVATASAYMFVLGLGLGLVMQVLVLAVQNAVPYSELGVATSGATLFRSIGGSFGASVLGAVFASQLTHNLTQAFPGQANPGGGHIDPSALAQLPPAVHDAYVQAFTDSLNVVFLVAAAIGVAAFALTWFIKELPLRDTVATAGVGEAFAVPKDTDPLAELARELSILTRREQANRILERLAARAGVDLEPAEIWLLGRFNRDPGLDVHALADAYAIDPLRLDNAQRALVDAGLIEGWWHAHREGQADTRHAHQLRTRPARRALRRLAAGAAPGTTRADPGPRSPVHRHPRRSDDASPVSLIAELAEGTRPR